MLTCVLTPSGTYPSVKLEVSSVATSGMQFDVNADARILWWFCFKITIITEGECWHLLMCGQLGACHSLFVRVDTWAASLSPPFFPSLQTLLAPVPQYHLVFPSVLVSPPRSTKKQDMYCFMFPDEDHCGVYSLKETRDPINVIMILSPTHCQPITFPSFVDKLWSIVKLQYCRCSYFRTKGQISAQIMSEFLSQACRRLGLIFSLSSLKSSVYH